MENEAAAAAAPSLAETWRYKHRLESDLSLAEYIGTRPTGQLFQELVDDFASLLPASVDREVLSQSLESLLDVEITQPILSDTMWRIAGNLPALRRRRPVPPWSGHPYEEWAPLHIAAARWQRNRFGDAGLELTFRILAGLACPLRIQQFWSTAKCAVAARRLGFTASWGDYPLQDPTELVNLRLLGLFPVQAGETPQFTQLADLRQRSAGLWEYNRKILAKRHRKGYTCPRQFQHDCFRCWVGSDQCPAATHQETYVSGFCEHCQQTSWFLPGKLSCCLNCLKRIALKKEQS